MNLYFCRVMKKKTYIFVLITLIAGMTFFGTDLIGQPPPPGGLGNNDIDDPGSPINLNWTLIVSIGIFFITFILKGKPQNATD